LIDCSVFCSFDGNDLISSFRDDKDGDSLVLDFTIFCLRYDDIIHKEDLSGYRIFLTPGFYVSFCTEALYHSFILLFLLFYIFLGNWWSDVVIVIVSACWLQLVRS
jgi:hypothetical protein